MDCGNYYLLQIYCNRKKIGEKNGQEEKSKEEEVV
jgi:hypothetical protein